MTVNESFGNFHFSKASAKDNQDIINHVKANPIIMDIDYIMDRRNDFFQLHRLKEGSIVLIARNKITKDLCACISFLRLSGFCDSEEIDFQYITDLIKDTEKGSPLLMQHLLNFGLERFFNTEFIVGIINRKNYRARRFSKSSGLLFIPEIVGSFYYYEIVPFRERKISKYLHLCPATGPLLDDALQFINKHYKDYLLFRNLDRPLINQMLEFLPDFSLRNIILAFRDDQLCGAMIYYDPSEIVSLMISKTDRKTDIIMRILTAVNRITGLFVSPPRKGDHIRTLQVRYLAGEDSVRSQLMIYAENLAFVRKYHSVSMLIDKREKFSIPNRFYFKYESLMYLAYKKSFEPRVKLFSEYPIFLDITYT